MAQFIGGPLDGQQVDTTKNAEIADPTKNGMYTIYPITTDQSTSPTHIVCYQIKNGNMHHHSTKTREQLLTNNY